MIRTIIDQIKTAITSKPYVERFGGVVMPVTRFDEVDEGMVLRQTFPISPQVTGLQCWEQGRYHDLVPNDQYKSIFYFEELDGMQTNSRRKVKDHMVEHRGRVRLVGWMNLQKLGIENEYNVAERIAFQLAGDIEGTYQLSAPLSKAMATIVPIGIQPKSSNIFDRYTYDNESGFLLYPFDFFAFDFEVLLSLKLDCIDEITISSPIACIDLS